MRPRQLDCRRREPLESPLLDRASAAGDGAPTRRRFVGRRARRHGCARHQAVEAGTACVRRGDGRANAASIRRAALIAVCSAGSCGTRRVSSGPPPAMSKPDPGGRAGNRHQRVAANVALEVDREIVASRPPFARPCEQGARRRRAAAAREPRCIERLDAVDAAETPGHVGVPAAHHEVDRRLRRHAADGFDGRSRHQQVADALESQKQYPRRLGRRTSSRQQPAEGRQRRQGDVRSADGQPLTRIQNLQMGKHSAAANAIECGAAKGRALRSV